MDNTRDYKSLEQRLGNDTLDLLYEWLPGGKLNGNEYECGDLQGNEGGSFKYNIKSGKWSDFATGEKGMHLVSLYAAINNVSQSKAYDDLGGRKTYSWVPKRRVCAR